MKSSAARVQRPVPITISENSYLKGYSGLTYHSQGLDDFEEILSRASDWSDLNWLYFQAADRAIVFEKPFTAAGARIVAFPWHNVATRVGPEVIAVSEFETYPTSLVAAFAASLVFMAVAVVFGALALVLSSKVLFGGLGLALMLGGILWYGSLAWAEEIADKKNAAR